MTTSISWMIKLSLQYQLKTEEEIQMHLEPIVDEAELKKTPKNTSLSSPSYISGIATDVSVEHIPIN
jgi:hypothetical protein